MSAPRRPGRRGFVFIAAPAPCASYTPTPRPRLLAMAAAIWHDWKINATTRRSLIAYDH